MLLRAARRAIRFVMADDGSLKARVVRSGIWVSSGEIVINIIAVLKSVVLARLLTPDIFGLMGLCALVLSVIETFTRPGIGQALIQRQASFDEARDTAFTLLMARGVLLAVLLFLLAPAAAWFYESNELEQLLKVLAAVFVIGGLSNVNTIARQKELDFRNLAFLNQVSVLLGSMITIGAAFWLRNVWALVIGQFANTFANTLLSYYFVPGRPRLAMNWRIAGELLSYGKFITASSAILFVATSLDTAVIGKVLGTTELGYYVLAFTMANLATTTFAKLASGVMLPAYSKLQADRPALKRAYLRTMQLVFLVTLPATVGVILTAEALIHVVYGPKWSPAVLPLQILVLFGLLRSMTSINGYFFEGIGLPKLSMYAGLFRLACLLPIIVPMTMKFGLAGAAIAVTATMAIQWLVFLYYMARQIGVTIRQTALALADPFWKSCMMGAAVYGLSLHIDSMTIAGLASVVVSGVAFYLLLNAKLLARIKTQGI